MMKAQDGEGYGALVRMRVAGPSEAAKRGAVAFLIRSLATDDRRAPHTGVTHYDPKAFKIPAGALSVPDAELLDHMSARGLPLRLKLVLVSRMEERGQSETVVGEIVGRERPDEIVLIGGHLDSWDLGQGAIDDGAGVAATMAAAKLIADLPQHPRRTLRVALFGAEEVGETHAPFAKAHAAELDKHVIASECDFGAAPVYRIDLPAGAVSSPYGQALANVTARLPAVLGPGPAQDGGADLVDLTGVPLAGLAQDGTHYFDLHHTADDTLDKVDAKEMDRLTAAWVAFAYLAADSDVDFRALAKGATETPKRRR
jgi:Zn-dependent M28 family amino/carboxypeptidase